SARAESTAPSPRRGRVLPSLSSTRGIVHHYLESFSRIGQGLGTAPRPITALASRPSAVRDRESHVDDARQPGASPLTRWTRAPRSRAKDAGSPITALE